MSPLALGLMRVGGGNVDEYVYKKLPFILELLVYDPFMTPTKGCGFALTPTTVYRECIMTMFMAYLGQICSLFP